MNTRFVSLILAGAVTVAGCAPAATSTPEPAPTVAASATVAPTEAPVVEATGAPTAAPVVEAPSANLRTGCVDSYVEGVDYFPEKSTVTYSTGFSIAYHGNYKVITVQTPYPGAQPIEYVLVQCGTPAPEGYAAEQVIEVPVRHVISLSTTNLPHLDRLGVIDSLVAVDDATYASNPRVLEGVAAGTVSVIGSGPQINVEQALSIEPDVVLAYGSGSPEFDSYPKLQEAGLKVVFNADWLENTPLGRSEWGKFIAAFYNAEGEAEKLFDATAGKYEELQALVRNVDTKPSVLLGLPFEGTWYVGGGNSFAATFLYDAGAIYPWADDGSTGALPFTFESVFERAGEADVWLNLGYVSDLKSMLDQDARFGEFKAYKDGAVWNNDARTSAAGGNDYYETATAEPDVVLADLIKILHPDLLPDHTLVYYRKVE